MKEMRIEKEIKLNSYQKKYLKKISDIKEIEEEIFNNHMELLELNRQWDLARAEAEILFEKAEKDRMNADKKDIQKTRAIIKKRITTNTLEQAIRKLQTELKKLKEIEK